IVRIEDVTDKVLRGVTDDMSAEARQSLIDQNMAYVRDHIQKEEWQDVTVKPFFHGNQYFAFVTVTYRDVRLVGAPPSSIGKFGADTDNWVWPRHTGDFSLFRIYAGPDNLPADPSPDNVPYRPKHFLPISLDGVEEGDFTLIFGFPGRTNEYLPAVAVDNIANGIDPARIEIRDLTLEIWDEAMRSDPQVKIQYASKFASLANGWKKWQGDVLGLKKTDAIGKKRRYEEQFAELVASRPEWQARYGHILPTFAELYAQAGPLEVAQTRYYETVTRNIEALRVASYLRRLVNTWKNNGPEAYAGYRDRLVNYLEGFYEDYRPELDQRVFGRQMRLYFDKGGDLLVDEAIRSHLAAAGNDFDAWAASVYEGSLLPKGEQLLA
ncbi:MAG: serine protease, partial [Bacteroidetes bacterium]